MLDPLFRFLMAFFPSMFFGKIGFASAILFFGVRFFPVITTVVGGALIGSVLFTYFARQFFTWWNRRFPYRLKASGIRRIRKILKLVRRYGWWVIALLSPVLLSYPGGCFIAYKFNKNRTMIVLSMTLSALGWTLLFFAFFYLFD